MDTTPEVPSEKVTISTPLSLRKATESTVQVNERPRKLFVKNTFKDQLSYEEFWESFRLVAASIVTAGKTLSDPLGICIMLYGKEFSMPLKPDTPRSPPGKKPSAMRLEVYREDRRDWVRLEEKVVEETSKLASILFQEFDKPIQEFMKAKDPDISSHHKIVSMFKLSRDAYMMGQSSVSYVVQEKFKSDLFAFKNKSQRKDETIYDLKRRLEALNREGVSIGMDPLSDR